MPIPGLVMPSRASRPASSHLILLHARDTVEAPRIRHALTGLPWPLRVVDTHTGLSAALRAATSGCVVAEVASPREDCHRLQFELKTSGGDWLLIVLTRSPAISAVVSALRLGAHDLIELPVVERVLRQRVVAAMRSLDSG